MKHSIPVGSLRPSPFPFRVHHPGHAWDGQIVIHEHDGLCYALAEPGAPGYAVPQNSLVRLPAAEAEQVLITYKQRTHVRQRQE